MAPGKITLKELAKILNVSVSTVSKSLANDNEISDKTKRKVKALANHYNYVPNQYAINLRKGTTKTIGVIIPNILNPFFARVLIGLENSLAAKGYNIITSISHESLEKEIKCVNMMSNGSIDGLIMCLTKETYIKSNFNHINSIINKSLPIVLFDRINNDFKCDKVAIDDFQASYRATEHLINKGCKKIALVSTINDIMLGQLRLEGYKLALQDNGIPYNSKWVVRHSNSNHFNASITEVLKSKAIDGVFGVNEKAIISTINAAKLMDFDLCKSLPVIAFCNQSQLNNHPSLIIIDQHAIDIGEKTAQILLKRLKINKKENYTTTIIKASFGQETTLSKKIVYSKNDTFNI